MVEIEIDGQLVNAEPGEMVIAVTDRESISVPRFCYHKKLSISASCRMCLVDVEGAPKPQPACSTPIAEGMKIHTQNEKAVASQKAVMEFLLINHPLDCPICDQGGECELQDVAVEYGSDVSRFSEGKRIVAPSDIGPLIQTDMTRCIHCTRCVRFGNEIAGIMEMGATGRGEELKIEPFLAEGITSELSGNMIDVCPVGALTSKPFRYELRSWQMSSIESIARHDLVGSNLYAQTYKGNVKRVVSGDNDAVNETWISDRDRFSYEGLSHENRLLSPQIKVEGQWKEVEWDVALDFAVKGLNRNILNSRNMAKLGGLASNTATLEELYLMQKLLREMGCENIDHRLNVKNLNNTIHLKSTMALADLEAVDYGLIIGANLRLEQPMINHRLRKAQLSGANITALNVKDFDYNYKVKSNAIAPSEIANTLAGVLKILLDKAQQELPEYLLAVSPNKQTVELANELLEADNSVLILGEHLINNAQASSISNLTAEIAKLTNSTTLNLTATANSIGAQQMGFVPNSTGMNTNEMFEADMCAFLLLDIYPEYDFHHSATALSALSKNDVFVISLNSFSNELVSQYSDVMLPMAAMFETSGTHMNIDGKMQSFSAAVSAPGEAKPVWKILKVLADLLELPGFHYENSAKVMEGISHQSVQSHEHDTSVNLGDRTTLVETIWMHSPYQSDVLLRHADSLSVSKIGQINTASMNASTAKILSLSDKDSYLGVPVEIIETMADQCVFVSSNQATNIGGLK
ncbi:NADH-ubiquinone oxidoreductase chain G (EC 1.6.5.3) [uncultured Gammaproteobacteria bacterium]|uniref:NADH-quinone oxidoreductase subunit NuoG n=1 Tax=Bathymodiolus heckerae thiotrophic gill symbiont TaxID=1052212 RepID=UPI0010AF857F|nr:NADH-quinone oxidoreductase subunit NuoG [Bathymodiolus heckerae thiotrophic gill symbiont]CAC9543531.1 NADH-ubiquinone oxidoreductase chain G (EC 1.6.5.3) [uncultured Gammaproteobacteria bacterium]CAC9594565.1 NADH-ubiquinone oxidoreductase chain G (EC 1.6.5.3) [uncultured Gammaproteobacteria bacterium]CAC9598298.1 NADH-ubiquinone oxidoreductase chain G (EC 1.6.5.3) [uncultured Gammaproteobacteria bacterium]CAC9957038.1 NADH-ubiquinone oxidoreductase chain G (EC 1.6.5.3) [uncultured Gammapr